MLPSAIRRRGVVTRSKDDARLLPYQNRLRIWTDRRGLAAREVSHGIVRSMAKRPRAAHVGVVRNARKLVALPVENAKRPARRRGRPPLPREDAERVQIVELSLSGRTAAAIAADTGWTIDEVCAVRRQYLPTTTLAAHYLKAKALQLAERIVAEANVEEAIDVLSRPNIGVLEPLPKGQSQPPIRIFTSIDISSLGGVNVRGESTAAGNTSTANDRADSPSDGPERLTISR